MPTPKTCAALPPTLPTPHHHQDADKRWIALAPMDGVTDHVFRTLITEGYNGQSGIDICVTEFVRVTDQKIPDAVFLRHCPELEQGSRTPSGTPVMVQLLGGAALPMAQAAKRAVELGAAGIDINFGCPAKTVNRHDGGASLLRAPERIAKVCAAVRAEVPDHLPVSAKIRLGWDSDQDLEALATAAQEGGASWLTIHARTKAQMYRPPVNWRALRRACRAIDIPVVANGDIFDPSSDQQCRIQSDCASVMIGRGIMADPGIFLRLRGKNIAKWNLQELAPLWSLYGERMISANAARVHPLGRVKQWVRMAAQIRDELKPAFDQIKRLQDWECAKELLDSWAASSAPEEGAQLRLHRLPKRATLPSRAAPP